MNTSTNSFKLHHRLGKRAAKKRLRNLLTLKNIKGALPHLKKMIEGKWKNSYDGSYTATGTTTCELSIVVQQGMIVVEAKSSSLVFQQSCSGQIEKYLIGKFKK